MADFQAPSGPPPPRVPEGWVARWNDQYKEWFYVNTVTKKSQWDKPTAPATGVSDDPGGPPPNYSPGSGPAPSDSKKNPFTSSNTNFSDGDRRGGRSPFSQEQEDERLARQMQQEENQRAFGTGGQGGGAASSYMSGAGSGPHVGSGPSADADGSSGQRGLFGKLFNKNKNSAQQQYGSGNNGGYPGQGYGPTGYANTPPPPQQGYGGYGGGYGQPSGGYYGGPPQQQGYYGGPPQGYYGGGGYQQQQPQRQGMGTAGAAALGVGGGLLGGMLLGEAMDGGDGGGDGGGDWGGDDGGGDGGGDF
ncbi:hypothetical protein SEPCBS57363_002304 [Sporothrix epigloea]|uniref:WW domain-containing protein n=1 Tax=Sporothrix epigloea TaxID=1892477 RepID=A0ABP0DF56_9PEZI